MENVTEEELKTLKEKASKFDGIESEIDYYNEQGKFDGDDPELEDVGKFIASYFGYL